MVSVGVDEKPNVPRGTPKHLASQHQTVSIGELSAIGRPPVTQIRLYWAMQKSPGLTAREYGQVLRISQGAALQAKARLRQRQSKPPAGSYDISKFCPECRRPAVVLDPSTNLLTCSHCGVELKVSPFVDSKLAIPFGGQEYALPSIIDHNLGSDPNRTIVELRYWTPVRILGRDKEPEEGWPAREAITEPYLAALGHTHWAHIKVKGEDDPMTRRALEILSRKLRTIDLPQPVYLWAARLGVDVRKCVNCLEGPKHLSELAESVMQDGQVWMKEELAKRIRKMQSVPCLETVVDQVIREAVGGAIEKARTVDRT